MDGQRVVEPGRVARGRVRRRRLRDRQVGLGIDGRRRGRGVVARGRIVRRRRRPSPCSSIDVALRRRRTRPSRVIIDVDRVARRRACPRLTEPVHVVVGVQPEPVSTQYFGDVRCESSVSCTVTFCASDGPLFVAVIVYVRSLPASTGSGESTFRSAASACVVIATVSLSESAAAVVRGRVRRVRDGRSRRGRGSDAVGDRDRLRRAGLEVRQRARDRLHVACRRPGTCSRPLATPVTISRGVDGVGEADVVGLRDAGVLDVDRERVAGRARVHRVVGERLRREQRHVLDDRDRVGARRRSVLVRRARARCCVTLGSDSVVVSTW